MHARNQSPWADGVGVLIAKPVVLWNQSMTGLYLDAAQRAQSGVHSGHMICTVADGASQPDLRRNRLWPVNACCYPRACPVPINLKR